MLRFNLYAVDSILWKLGTKTFTENMIPQTTLLRANLIENAIILAIGDAWKYLRMFPVDQADFSEILQDSESRDIFSHHSFSYLQST